MNDVKKIVESAMPKVNIDLEKNVAQFLKFISNPGQCRSCKAHVFWVSTNSGKPMPINKDLTSHFSTCPQSRQWRKDKQFKKDDV